MFNKGKIRGMLVLVCMLMVCQIQAASLEIAIPMIYENVATFNEGLGAVQLGGKWGFINHEGDWVIKPRFENIQYFSQGLAAAQIDGKWGFIDKQGKWVIEPIYGYVGSFSDGLARFGKDEFIAYDETIDDFAEFGVDGFIDQTGKVVISSVRTADGTIKPLNHYRLVGDFSNGLAAVNIYSNTFNSDSGSINKRGEMLIDGYNSVFNFSDGLAKAVYLERNLKALRAQYIEDPNYEPEWRTAYIDSQGKRVLDNLPYRWTGDFRNGLAPAQDGRTGKVGAIDKKGQLVIPCKYEDVWALEKDLIFVDIEEDLEKHKIGYINREDELIIPPVLTNVTAEAENIIIGKKSEEWPYTYYVYDYQGNEIAQVEADFLGYASEGLILIGKDYLWGYAKNPLYK